MATAGRTLSVIIALAATIISYRLASSPLEWTYFAIRLSVLGAFLWYSLIYPGIYSPLRDLPKPSGNTLFSAQFYQRLREPVGQSMRAWINETPNDGIIRYFDLFNTERLVVTNPTALAELLVHKTSEFNKPPHFVSGIGTILGLGLFLVEGEEHKRQQNLLNPAFNRQRIQDLYPLFWTKGKELIDALIVHTWHTPDKPCVSVDVCEWMSRATLDIIGTAGMDEDFDTIRHPKSELYQTHNKLFKTSRVARLMGTIRFVSPEWVIHKALIIHNSDILHAAGIIKRICLSAIQRAKKNPPAPNAKGSSIISVALKSRGFTETDLVDQLMTFLVAGHETTASALSWCICMLCKYPEMQLKLRQELRSGLPNPRTTIYSVAAAEFDTLPFLNAFCNETLRLFPPVPLTARVAAHDTTLLDHVIPKGTYVFISPWAINLSKELWGEDADEFNPERWMEGTDRNNNGGANSNYAFLTFLHGDRRCIGEGLARGELKVLLAALASTFEMEFVDKGYEVAVKNGVTAKPKGLFITLKLVGEGWN